MSGNEQETQPFRVDVGLEDRISDRSPSFVRPASLENPFIAEKPPRRMVHPSQELLSVLNSSQSALQWQQRLRTELVAQTKADLDQIIGMHVTDSHEKTEPGRDTSQLQQHGTCERGCRDQSQLSDPFTPPGQIGSIPWSVPAPPTIHHKDKGGLLHGADGRTIRHLDEPLNISQERHYLHGPISNRQEGRGNRQMHETPTPRSWNPELRPLMTMGPMGVLMENEELRNQNRALMGLVRRHLGLNDGEIEVLMQVEMAKGEL